MTKLVKTHKLNVGILGATGNLGRQVFQILYERLFPYQQLRVFGSESSQGKSLSTEEGKLFSLEIASQSQFDDIHLAFICTPAQVANDYIRKLRAVGARIIDLSQATSLSPKVPLLTARNNDLHSDTQIYAVPLPVVTSVQSLLADLHEENPIKDIHLHCLYSVSLMGRKGLQELMQQTKDSLMNKPSPVEVFPKTIAFNLIPQVGYLNKLGISSEEEMIEGQIKKIFKNSMKVSVECAWIPCFSGLAVHMTTQFNNPVNLDFFRKHWMKNPFVNPHSLRQTEEICPTPMDVIGEDSAFVSRIRLDNKNPNNVRFWVMFDNVRVGSALQAVQLAEQLIAKHKF